MRTALLLLAFALSACGDDTTVIASPDLAVDACLGQTCCPGRACSPVGAACSAIDLSCTCDADQTYHCHPPAKPPDLATPTFD